ncbi:MAG: cupin domain-containing protein [Kiritimatiellae bacterium]|nr:cupin domain-containing protein [Kiritimatiellia bacterium]MDD4734519.1 cupin domain-containing protein [Kiritimatiellia bacterium]
MKNSTRFITTGAALFIFNVLVTAEPLHAACCASEPTPAPTRQEIIDGLGLIPMNDGACIGYYKELYECNVKADIDKPRAAASSIYYLMSGGLFDPWHKITCDELLAYHAGAPMNQMLIYPDGSFKTFVLGPDPRLGQQPQIIIPANTWMGFRMADDSPDAWGLYGVFCAHGFHLDDISMTNGPALGELYPDTIETMKKLRMYE